MNDYVISVILGIIEGLTEFLPVSSTAHLRVAEALMHIDLASGYWKMYTIVIQLGAILCLPVYFHARIRQFVSTFPRGARGDRTPLTHPLGLTCVAFFCTAVPAFLLVKVIGKHLESLFIMGSALLIGGVIMWAVDARQAPAEAEGQRKPGRIRVWSMEEMGLGQAIWIGCCQTLSAIFPGTSRSMSTIAAGQLVGMSRAAALEFSFFLSMPTMVVATVYELLKTMVGKHGSGWGAVQMDAHAWIVLAIGFVVSFVVAYAAVAWFMAWVRRRGFAPFALYRIVLGLAVLIWATQLGR